VKSNKYDVVVIGAGPSGSIAARNLASKGYQVLLAEKRPVVGAPVRCGEATGPRARIADFMTVNEDYIETDIHGVIVHGPGGVSIRYDKPEIGTMLDRKLFDQDIANQAVRAGAELSVSTRIAGISPATGGVREITVVDETSKQETKITAPMIVGADGAEALSGRWVGIKSRQLPPYTCTAIEFRIDAVDENPNHLTFWQGHGLLNKGYIWVFPKVKSRVINLGSGVLTPKMGEMNMYDLSMAFKKEHFPDARILEVHGGAVPVSGNLDEYVEERFLLSGDAAHHTNPMTGGGIMAGIVAGDLAAKWIDKGLKAGNLSKEFLAQYQMDCWTTFGKNHHKEMKIRDFVLGLPAAQQAGFYRIFQDMVKGNFSKLSMAKGYARIAGVAARNWRLTKKVAFG
jgi:digeranylgeranylglycerophospholipid reductase